MNKLLITILILFSLVGYSQEESPNLSGEKLNGLIEFLENEGLSEERIQLIINGLIEDPDLYNDLWQKLVSEALDQDSTKWGFLNDLNIEFKTFQPVDSSTTSLGFYYDFDFDYVKFKEKGKSRISNSISLTAKGNVAFNKNVNPNDFLETNLNYSFSKYIGGVVAQNDEEIFKKLNEIEDKLVTLEDPNSKEALKLWDEFGSYLKMTTQYYYSIRPKFGYESNQDFSTSQFTPGLMVNLGLKAWDKNSTTSKLNIFDYPFALLRLITGTDKKFTPYGSTFPTLGAGIDYIIPQKDQEREAILGNLDPFPRFMIESGFKTFISRVKKENIFFSANIRYYKELGAEKEIKEAKLDSHLFFVMALQSTSGFYVSYSYGKLPFDAKEDQVYSLGFNYNF